MQLVALNFEAGTLNLELDSGDCELLAQVFSTATGHDDTRHNHLADLALLFTLANVATKVYGLANTDEEVHATLQKAIARCGESVGGKYRAEGGQAR
jgi:hypothetical protein